MAQVLVVTSGKGGVGKTTSTAALGAALAHDGAKVVVIDFDVGLRNMKSGRCGAGLSPSLKDLRSWMSTYVDRRPLSALSCLFL